MIRDLTQEAWKALVDGVSSKSDNLINADKAYSGSFMRKGGRRGCREPTRKLC